MKYQAILGMPPFGVPQSEKEQAAFTVSQSSDGETQGMLSGIRPGFKNIRLQPGEGRKNRKAGTDSDDPCLPFQRRRS